MSWSKWDISITLANNNTMLIPETYSGKEGKSQKGILVGGRTLCDYLVLRKDTIHSAKRYNNGKVFYDVVRNSIVNVM